MIFLKKKHTLNNISVSVVEQPTVLWEVR